MRGGRGMPVVYHPSSLLATSKVLNDGLTPTPDYLKREVERRKQVYQQEQAMMAYGSALAAQQAQWAMQNFYAPYYYAPYPHYHHHW
jgi:hypothetical protein